MADTTGITRRAKKDGSDVYGIRVTFIDAGGVERSKSGTFDREADAIRARDEWRQLRHRGDLAATDRTTVEKFLEGWMVQNVADGLSPYTIAGYQSKIDCYIVPVIGPMRLEDVKRVHVKRVYAAMEPRRHHKTGKPLSAETKAAVRRVLHNALEAAIDDELIRANPASAQRRRHVKRQNRDDETPVRAKTTLTAEQVVRLVKTARAAGDDKFYVSVLLASSTGMRRGEFLAVRWRDLHTTVGKGGPRTGHIDVKRALVRGPEGLRFDPPKTVKSERTIPLPGQTIRELEAYRKRQNERRLAVGSLWHNNDLIIDSGFGKPWDPNKLSRAFAEVAGKLSLPITLHGLRHTYGSLLIDKGVPVTVVSELLGHSTVTLTLNSYGHGVPGAHEQAVKMLGETYAAVRGA